MVLSEEGALQQAAHNAKWRSIRSTHSPKRNTHHHQDSVVVYKPQTNVSIYKPVDEKEKT